MSGYNDFIGFTYDGKHSIEYFNIYRTSDGARYSDTLVPQITDKTENIARVDGQQYLYSTHNVKTFAISIAFDHLTETKYREMRQWLNGKKLSQLIFDESPYKIYSAKVTGTPTLKTICFTEGKNRIYKGEGTIQFTCYYPFAYTPDFSNAPAPTRKTINSMATVPCGLFVRGGGALINEMQRPFEAKCYELLDGEWYEQTKTFATGEHNISTPLYIQEITIDKIVSTSNIIIDNISYYYTTNNCFEAETADGRNINSYPLYKYTNKMEWLATSGLSSIVDSNNNLGDVPATFEVTMAQAAAGTKFTVHDCEIELKEDCRDLVWDSKTGLVKGKKGESTTEQALYYLGKSYGTLIPGVNNINLPSGAILKYQYWYY